MYRTADGWIAISLNPTAKLAVTLDSPELAAFDHPKDPIRRREAIHQLVSTAVRSRSTDAIVKAFDRYNILVRAGQ